MGLRFGTFIEIGGVRDFQGTVHRPMYRDIPGFLGF